ncbi:MAG: DEAD/DEAH box helicase, partial [Armatimonadota bacterium]|nr:DEAD/DEAH box helicase [Armatimonadota bacterium]
MSTQTLLQDPARTSGFDRFPLRAETLRAIAHLGWRTPTPIQERVIPILLEGRDLIGQAQTGSGKTGAYGIPLVERVDPEPQDTAPPKTGPQALVLVPTRELALQVTDDLRALGAGRALRVVALFGGQPIEQQFAALRRAPLVVVATPGRLLDHLGRGTVRLTAVRVVVLDEADRMLDMGFLLDVSRILAATPPVRQTGLFSATMPPAVRTLAEQRMRRPVWVAIDAPVPTVETVEQYYVEVAERDKVRALRLLLSREPVASALIFRRTKHRADRLARLLGERHRVGVLHGGMAQGARLRALRAFAEGERPLLVTTNVAARGLDLPAVSHVINFDMPEDVDTYVHRVGRTARAGRTGVAITFVGEHDLEVFDALRRRLGAR